MSVLRWISGEGPSANHGIKAARGELQWEVPVYDDGFLWMGDLARLATFYGKSKVAGKVDGCWRKWLHKLGQKYAYNLIRLNLVSAEEVSRWIAAKNKSVQDEVPEGLPPHLPGAPLPAGGAPVGCPASGACRASGAGWHAGQQQDCPLSQKAGDPVPPTTRRPAGPRVGGVALHIADPGPLVWPPASVTTGACRRF